MEELEFSLSADFSQRLSGEKRKMEDFFGEKLEAERGFAEKMGKKLERDFAVRRPNFFSGEIQIGGGCWRKSISSNTYISTHRLHP